jgi:hypothetical protein
MPLSHQNQGKYLSKKFDKDRQDAYIRPDTFASDEQLWMELSNLREAGVRDPDKWMITTIPIGDPLDKDSTKFIDVRRARKFVNVDESVPDYK